MIIDRILRLPAVQLARGESRSTIYNRLRDRLMPRPIRLGPRMVGWPESEIAALNAARIRGANDEEIRALVLDLEALRKKDAA
jgi:prophage regulatory protein